MVRLAGGGWSIRVAGFAPQGAPHGGVPADVFRRHG